MLTGNIESNRSCNPAVENKLIVMFYHSGGCVNNTALPATSHTTSAPTPPVSAFTRMISEQYGTVFKNMGYQKIQKIYSIWICPAPAEKRNGSILQYRIVEKEVTGKSFINEDD